MTTIIILALYALAGAVWLAIIDEIRFERTVREERERIEHWKAEARLCEDHAEQVRAYRDALRTQERIGAARRP